MSTLRVNTLQDATGSNQPAMVGAAKAWVNFNGTGTVAIREQFNVSSITDNGTGNYTVNFTTAMTDANYVPVCSTAGFSLTNNARSIMIGGSGGVATLKTTTQLQVTVGDAYSAVVLDHAECNVTIFR